MHIPSLLTHSSRRNAGRGRGQHYHNPHLTLTIPSLSSLFRRPRPPGLDLPNPTSLPPPHVRDHAQFSDDPLDGRELRLDEELAYQLAADQDILYEQERLTKLRHRHWHVYGGETEQSFAIVINRSRDNLDADRESDTTEYTSSTNTSYDLDGASPYSTPATGNTTASTTSRFSFDIPDWELDVNNAEADIGHGLPTWVLAPDANLPGLESYASSFDTDDEEIDAASFDRDGIGVAPVPASPPPQFTASPIATSTSPSPTANLLSPPASASPTSCALPDADIIPGAPNHSRSRSRTSITASRSSSLKDAPKAENWPF